jgi:hypothetical protein
MHDRRPVSEGLTEQQPLHAQAHRFAPPGPQAVAVRQVGGISSIRGLKAAPPPWSRPKSG